MPLMQMRRPLLSFIAGGHNACIAYSSCHGCSVLHVPTPYDVSIVTGIQHLWDGWITSVYYGKVLIRDDKLQVGGWGDEYRTYLKFDTTGLPKTVTRAVLNVM